MQRACGLKQFLATQNFNQFLRQRLRRQIVFAKLVTCSIPMRNMVFSKISHVKICESPVSCKVWGVRGAVIWGRGLFMAPKLRELSRFTKRTIQAFSGLLCGGLTAIPPHAAWGSAPVVVFSFVRFPNDGAGHLACQFRLGRCVTSDQGRRL